MDIFELQLSKDVSTLGMTEERKTKIAHVLAHRQNDLTVILENVFDVHNVSAIMRTADAVGITEIFLIYSRTPPPGRWGYRSSGSAYKWISTHHFDDAETCIAAVRRKYDRIYTTNLSAGATSIFEMDFTQSLALVFGNEQKGLSDEICSLCDGNFAIPQVGMIHSLNISVACAVTLYEAFRQKQAAGHFAQQKLSKAAFEDLQKSWETPSEI